MAITGHKSESSLKHYARTNNAKKKEMSTVIAARMQENDPLSSISESTCEDLLDGLPLLTDSQEKMILSESNFNIQTASTSTTQHFHFHGPKFLTTSKIT